MHWKFNQLVALSPTSLNIAPIIFCKLFLKQLNCFGLTFDGVEQSGMHFSTMNCIVVDKQRPLSIYTLYWFN